MEYKGKRKLYLCGAVLILLLTDCGKSPEVLSTEDGPDTGRYPLGAWKQAYIEYVRKQDPEIWEGYELIYLDEDDVPELVQAGRYSAAGINIINFYNGRLHETQLNRLSFTYLEKGKLLRNSGGNTGAFFDIIYSLEEGKMEQIAEGNYRMQFDENDAPVYDQFKWNGVDVTEEEYGRKLQEIFDSSRAQGPDPLYTAEEIIQLCNSAEQAKLQTEKNGP